MCDTYLPPLSSKWFIFGCLAELPGLVAIGKSAPLAKAFRRAANAIA
jgi:hypothetical protein